MNPIEFHVLEHMPKMFKTSPKSTVSAKCGSEVSSKGPCDEGLVPGLWCYWEVVGPLEGGMQWKACHQGYALAGAAWILLFLSLCCLAAMLRLTPLSGTCHDTPCYCRPRSDSGRWRGWGSTIRATGLLEWQHSDWSFCLHMRTPGVEHWVLDVSLRFTLWQVILAYKVTTGNQATVSQEFIFSAITETK